VLALAICLALTGSSCFKSEGPAATKAARAWALARSESNMFRPTGKVLEGVTPQMRSHLDDLMLRSGAAPSQALELKGIRVPSSVQGLSAAAVTESVPVTRLKSLISKYGRDAYEWTCTVAGEIESAVHGGQVPTPGLVFSKLGWPKSTYATFMEAYNIVYSPTDTQADKTGQLLIWASCLAA
jgi:hypothetical protein